MIISSYPRETVEYVKFDHVTVNGEAALGFKYAIAQEKGRPPATTDTDGWLTPATVDGAEAFLLDGLAPGFYTVWVKVDAVPEHVVIEAGEFSVD